MDTFARGSLPLLLLALPLMWAAESNEEPPIVVTKYGMLEGKRVSVKRTHKSIYSYFSIPFAKPPVGPLRFRAPQPAEAWTGIRQATKLQAGCLQDKSMLKSFMEMIKLEPYSLIFREDCLYVNVHTPVRPNNTKTKLPVMVWIHGGGFQMGDSYMYNGAPLAAYEDVVVVVIQYRLGILGFLSTGDEHLPGNLGMLDQVAALKWVQENIESFGGDPGSVTIFGESAGSMSVALHVVSPLSSGLFHKAISQSGSIVLGPLFSSDPKQMALMIANLAGCNTNQSKEIVDCLAKMSEEELMNMPKLPKDVLLFPVVDGVFLPRNADLLFAANEINPVPYLLGITNHEWSWLLPKMLNPPGWEEGMDRETSDSILKNISKLNEDRLRLAIDEYMGDAQDKAKIRDFHLELMSDLFMVVPTIRMARMHRDAGHPVFLYEFQHRPGTYGIERPEFVKSDHGDDIGFVFGIMFLEDGVKFLGNVSEEEVALSRTVMAYWANFAKKGNPNREGLVFWPVYDQNEGYMQLRLKPQAEWKLKEHRMKFFTKLFQQEGREKNEQNGKGDERQRLELMSLTDAVQRSLCLNMNRLLLVFNYFWTQGDDYFQPIVKIENGFLRGKQLEVEESPRAVFGYIGIPFAAPPVGPLRFAPPVSPQSWTGIRNATSYPPMCLQKERKHPPPFSVPVSEDCLYLSVYTPAHPLDQNNSLPVMVWIHGGAFILGSGTVFHGTALAGHGNVVVVVMQYRISVSGFLSTGDNCAQGNFGFLDQLAALRWVQRNIAQFGGNPGMVTLFGESVGGLSVSLHTLSPLSVGLFHKAILQSGSALMPGLLPPSATQLAHEAASIAGCNDTRPQPLLHCLRNKTEEEMAQITNSLNELYQLIPALIVDGHFLPDDPQSMFQNGMFQKIPYLIGVTTEEAVASLVHPEKIIPSNWETGITREQIKEKINTYIKPLFGEENGELIYDEYFNDIHDPDTLKERYLDMFGDVFIAVPTLRAAQYYKDAGNPVFLYEFQHRASFFKRRIPQFKRAPHGAELTFVFGGPLIPDFEVLLGNMTEEEKELSKLVMSYWATFAWTGNPNRNDLPVWPVNGASEKYMQLNLTLQLGNKLKKDKLNFWSDKPAKIIPRILI
ncbi:uncharacterized protein ces2b [Mustelus asterias]